MLALPAAAARLRRGVSIIAVSVLVASMPLAVAQQYPPPAYPNPDQSPGYPGAAQPPAYSSQGYGGPGGPPPPQQEAIPPPPGAAMVWQPGYWSWSRHGWVWVSGRYVSRPYARAMGSRSLDPTTRGLGLGAGTLAMISGLALIATGRSPRLPLLAPPTLDAAAFCRLARTPASSVPGVRSAPVVVGRAQIVELSAGALGRA